MEILIIEDEAPAFRKLQNAILEVNPDAEILDVIDSVSEGVKWLQNNDHPDLIFSDIQLNDGLSFEIFEQVELRAPLIFVTAFDEYMLKAFKVNSIDYLLKPVKLKDVKQAIDKYNGLTNILSKNSHPNLQKLISQIHLEDKKYKSRFLVKKGEQLVTVDTEEVAHFVTRNGLVYLHTIDNKKYIVDYKLDEVINELKPEQFYRANRQYIINFNSIERIDKYYRGKLIVKLKSADDEKIIVSTEKAADFKRWLGL